MKEDRLPEVMDAQLVREATTDEVMAMA